MSKPEWKDVPRGVLVGFEADGADAGDTVRINGVDYTSPDALARALMAATLAEREACARTLESVAATYLPGGPMDAKGGLHLGATAIRARSKPLPNPLDPQ